MLGPTITLVSLALSLAWALFLRAGVYPSDWVTTILFVGCISFLYWLFVRRRLIAPPLSLWVRVFIWALPCYIAFQLIPLPLRLLRTLSPARAELVDALTPVMPAVSRAPLSVNPPAAVLWFFSFLCYIATFFLVRELCGRFADRIWIPALPLMCLAAGEAAIGILQVSAGWPNTEAVGTYTNHDHFSGLLEMVLPLCVIYGWVILRRRRETFDVSLWPAIGAGAAWATAALLFVAVIYSTSRIGIFDILCSLFLIIALNFGPRLPSQNWRMASLTILALAILAIFVFIPPDQLIERFADMASSGKITADTRLYFWRETLSLIDQFRWFGCGLGGFESAFLKYQGIANSFRVEMAHNDYLQYLAELGFIGFTILVVILVGILIPVSRGVRAGADENRRLLLVACCGSFLAIALHSLVDFNLYIPANAMTLAWIAGIASFNGQD